MLRLWLEVIRQLWLGQSLTEWVHFYSQLNELSILLLAHLVKAPFCKKNFFTSFSVLAVIRVVYLTDNWTKMEFGSY